MYNVSSEYLKAVSKPNREFKLLVRFYYKDGSQAEFNDSDIIGDSDVEILSQAISGNASSDKIDIGAAIAAKAILSIMDNDVNLHRYTGSSFEIYVYLKLETGEFEEVPMGRFYTDTSQLSRIKNKINIVGYDSMLSLMYALTDDHRRQLKGSTAADAVQFLAAYSNCGFEQDLSVFPNNSVPLDFDSPQVETARDGIMWIAQLLGCFAHIDRSGYLEFVPIKSEWKYYNDEHTLGTIIAVRNIQGSERYKTTFSDDRIHIVGLSMPDRDNNLITRVSSGLKDDANITIALDRNPLVINSSIPLRDILTAILNQVRTTYFYAFKTEIISDPALDAGDTIRLQGGVINGTNKNNDLIGFITHNVWRYRGHHEITNAGQVPIVYAEGETATAALASDAANPAASGNELFYLPAKSQAEKAQLAMGGIPDKLINQDKTSTFRIDSLSGVGFTHITERYNESAHWRISGNNERGLTITQYPGAGIPFPINGEPYRKLTFEPDTITYTTYNATTGEKTYDLTQGGGGTGGVTEEYVTDAISAHDSDESAHEDIRDEISGVRNSVTNIQNSVTSAWNSIHEVEDKVSDLESGGGGGTYTTKIAFKNGGFDLTFANKDGEETVNLFTVTEQNGKITKITNTTAGREIEVTYE